MPENRAATSIDPDTLPDIVSSLTSQLIDRVLPLWASEGGDTATGGFVERLDSHGHADRSAPGARAGAADLVLR